MSLSGHERSLSQRRHSDMLAASDPPGWEMTETIIRDATDDDLVQVLDLYRHLHPDEQLPAEKAKALWAELLSSPFVTVILAQVENQLVSSCTLAIVPNQFRTARSFACVKRETRFTADEALPKSAFSAPAIALVNDEPPQPPP
jgi:hypothetical protein